MRISPIEHRLLQELADIRFGELRLDPDRIGSVDWTADAQIHVRLHSTQERLLTRLRAEGPVEGVIRVQDGLPMVLLVERRSAFGRATIMTKLA